MNGLVAALVLWALAGWLASRGVAGWRSGTMPLDLSLGAQPIGFDRTTTPAWFWGTLAAHGALAAGFALAGVVTLLG